MNYFLINDNGDVTGVATAFNLIPAGQDYITRRDITDMMHASSIASELNSEMGDNRFIPVHNPSSLPAYDVIKAPKVGDEVSYSFNGDTYPCGTITRISTSLKVITCSTGKKFYRKGETGGWVNQKTWWLVMGHHTERNPSF